MRTGAATKDWEQIRAAFEITNQLNPISDPTMLTDSSMGAAVALDGDIALVGAPRDNHFGLADAGAVYVFVRVGGSWYLAHRLVAGDAEAGDHFGVSVAISGTTAIVGAESARINGDSAAGAVYTFGVSIFSWSEKQKLVASDSDHDFYFGCDVDVEGDTLIVGSWGADHGGAANTGAAYVFTRTGSTWTEQQKLVPSDAAPGDQTAQSVAISGETVAFSGTWDDYSGFTNTGSAYVFTRSGGTWTEQQKLTPSDAATEDRFGQTIDIDVDTVVVGSTNDYHSGLSYPGSAYVYVRSGGSWTEQQKLIASDSIGGLRLGSAVAVLGDVVLVGGVAETSGFYGAGAVYAFERSGSSWSESQKIVASDPDWWEYFGMAVAMDGTRALIGAWDDSNATGDDAGAAYVFTSSLGTWTEDMKLTGADSLYGDHFGESVAISGDTAIVGAPWDNHSDSSRAGSVYAFTNVGGAWTLQSKITPTVPANNMNFGTSVALLGDTAVVGTMESHSGFDDAGSVFVFERSGIDWVEQQRLTAPTPYSIQYFGSAVAFSADTLVVGAYGTGVNNPGAVHIFTNPGSGWVHQDTLVASDGANHDFFGWSVAISGDTIAVGSVNADHSSVTSAGAVYVFTRTGGSWFEHQKLIASDPANQDLFGCSLAIDDDLLVVGAEWNDHSGFNDAGSAHVFVRSGITWTWLQKLVAVVPEERAWFGGSVAVSDDLILVGAEQEDRFGYTDLGTVYLFEQSGGLWFDNQAISPTDPNARTFGSSVAMNNSSAVVGADRGSRGPAHDDYLSGVAFILDRSPEADLSIIKDDNEVTVVPGDEVTYLIAARNTGGPTDAIGASVTDFFPAELTGCSWTCSASGGGSCSAGGVGDIEEIVDLPVGGEVRFTATCTLDLSATGTLSNTASISIPPGMYDPNASNNSFTDDNIVETATADLRALVDFEFPYIVTGSTIQFEASADNVVMPGAHDLFGALVSGVFPPGLANCSWTCSPIGGAVCTPGPVAGDIADTVDLPYHGWVDYLVSCDVVGPIASNVVTTLTVTPPAYAVDPDLANNSSTDSAVIVLGADWGDAPDSYCTLASNYGANHGILPGYSIGAGVDGEANGQPTSNADGDDTAAMDDEDVLSGTPIVTAGDSNIELELSAGGAGYLSIWVDLNINGHWFDAGEKVVDNAPLTAGPNTLPVAIPASASPGLTFARLRFSSIPITQSLNDRVDGEVEDHRIRIVLPGTLIFADGFESGDTSAWHSGE